MTISVSVDEPDVQLGALEDGLMKSFLLLIEIRRELIHCRDGQQQVFLERQISAAYADLERMRRLYLETLEQAQSAELEARIMEQFMAAVERLLTRVGRGPITPQPIWAELPPALISRLDMFERRLDSLLAGQAALHADVRRGFATLYLRLDRIEQQAVAEIMAAIRAWRFPRDEMAEWLEEVRRLIVLWHEATAEREPILAHALDDMHATVESDLEIQSKLELTIPLIPCFLNYQLEVGTETEIPLQLLKEKLAERWRSIKERVLGRRGAT